jgi:hypothetical protein
MKTISCMHVDEKISWEHGSKQNDKKNRRNVDSRHRQCCGPWWAPEGSSSHDPIFKNRVSTSSEPLLNSSTPRAGSHTRAPLRGGRGMGIPSAGERGPIDDNGDARDGLSSVRILDPGIAGTTARGGVSVCEESLGIVDPDSRTGDRVGDIVGCKTSREVRLPVGKVMKGI